MNSGGGFGGARVSLAGQPTCSPRLGIDGVQLLVGRQHRSSFLRVLVDGGADRSGSYGGVAMIEVAENLLRGRDKPRS